MCRIAKRILSCILVLAMFFSAVLPVYAQSSGLPDTYNIKNEYVEYIVNSKNGGFVIKTVEGSMLRKSDQNKSILFQGDNYDTSFTTFRIDGKDYIFGNGYGFLNMGGSFISQPRNVSASTNSATWKIGDVEITQILELINDKSNPYMGNVKISYKAVNKGKTDVNIGARMLLDTMLGNNDGAAFELGGALQSKVTAEKKLRGDEVPQYWKSMDNTALPNIVSYGFTSGWGNRKPDVMTMGHWNNLAGTKWDYTVDPTINFTRTDSKYGTADSALAMYWNPSVLKAGQSVNYETYYGIMAQNSADKTAGFSLNAFTGKKKLALDSTGRNYENDGMFEITAEADNSITDAVDLTNVTAVLQLEEGLQLAAEEVKGKFVQSLAKGSSHTFKWKVKAVSQAKYSIKQFKVEVQPDGYAEAVSAGDYILLPGTVQKQPDILFSSITPEKLYYQGIKYVNMKGRGFSLYNDKGSWEMYITDMNGIKKAIPDENVVIVDDTQMTVRIEGDFALGEYGIVVEWSGGSMPSGTIQTLPVKIAMTNDPKDRNDYYGILCVVRSGSSYDLKTFKDENELASYIASNGKSSIMLELRGYLTKLTGADKSYMADTSLDPVIMNNIVVYTGEPMSIKKESNKITISGNGPIQVIGALTFWKWAFEVSLYDGRDYTLNQKPTNSQEQLEIKLTGLGSLIQSIGGFTMDLKYGVFQREEKDGAYYNLISFGGKMSLPVLPGSKSKSGDGNNSNTGDDDEDEQELGGFSVDMRDVLFGERKDKAQGFVGIDTTLGIEIPDNAFGGVIENGFKAELTINTIKHIYGISFEADIMVLECEGTLTIRLYEGKYPVPDELRFVGGGDPGIPVVPGILYVTKLGGGYSKLYESIFGDSWLPPVTLHLSGGLSLFALLTAETEQEISLSGYSMRGSASLKGIPVLKDFNLSLSWVDPIYAQVGATLSLFDIVVGSAQVYISPSYLEGWARVVIQIPREVPFVGGEVIAGVEVGISTVKVWGKIIVLGMDMGVAYYWDDESIEFITKADQYPSPGRQYAYAEKLEGEDGKTYKMLVGTNTHLLASSKSGYRFSNPTLCMAGEPIGYVKSDTILTLNTIKNEYRLTVPDGQKAAYLQIQYYDEKPSLTILKPDGTEYTLVEHKNDAEGHIVVDGNFKWQEISSGEKYAFVSLIGMDSIVGNWTIKASSPIDIILMGVEPLPELKEVKFTDVNASQKKVSWTIENPDGAIANIYLVKSEKDAGILAAQDISAGLNEKVIDIPETLQTGDYFIRVTMKKGDSYFESKLSKDYFRYINENQPQKVETVSISPYGNGYFEVNVTDTQNNVDGYILEAFDSSGKLYKSFNSQYFRKGEEIITGGWMPALVVDSYDSDGNPVYKEGPYIGLEPGKTYSISVIACRKIGDKIYFSEALKSSSVLLPVPKPANISIAFDEGFKDVLDENDKSIKITNRSSALFGFTSDQEVDSTVEVDGQPIGGVRSGKVWTVTISTEDGSHLLRVISEDKNGDVSSKSILYTVDTSAPQLFVESPRHGYIYTGGKVNLKGIFEKGAKYTVKLDGNTIYDNNSLGNYIGNDGSIDMSIDMSSSAKKLKHEIAVAAKDAAGNTAEYEASIIDGSIGLLKNVYIREKSATAGNLNEIQMTVGDSKSFVLIGVDNSGNEIELNTYQTNWSVLSGSGMAHVSQNGEVKALLSGETVILGSYELEESYCLQDALIVKIKDSEVIVPPNNEDNDDDDDDWYHYPAQQITTGTTAIAKFSAELLQSLIDKATVDKDGKKVISITIPKLSGAVKYSIGLPVEYFSGLADNISFKLITPFGIILVPSNMLYGANYDKNKMIYLNIASVDTASLSSELQAKIGRHPVIELSLSLDGKEIKWNNPNTKVKVMIPYKPTEEELKDPEHLVILCNDGSTKIVTIPSGRYDGKTCMMTFETTHFSKYAVAYVHKTFKDIDKFNWAKNDIEVLSSKGIINGTSQSTFSPAANITRADYLTLLVRTLGLTARFDSNFADVKMEDYYYDAVGIAKKLGITTGTGNNKFNPKACITREDMMVLTEKALKLIGKIEDNKDLKEIDRFKDKNLIASYAQRSAAAMVKEGLIVGSGGRINPKGNTTRAEAAVILYRIYNK